LRAESASEAAALAAIASLKPALVLLDVAFPDGYAVASGRNTVTFVF
jgi:CheY-like chemotaxis protein